MGHGERRHDRKCHGRRDRPARGDRTSRRRNPRARIYRRSGQWRRRRSSQRSDRPRKACASSSRPTARAGRRAVFPTLITDRIEVLEQLAAGAKAAVQVPGVLGFHLEGPALNKSRKGIHLESEIRKPDARDLAALKSFGDCGRSLVTLAPECVPPGLIDELVGVGLRVSAGHSEATAAQLKQAADRGSDRCHAPVQRHVTIDPPRARTRRCGAR